MPLKRIDRSDGYQVAPGSTDIRGWVLLDARQRAVGRITALIFDTMTEEVHEAIAQLDDPMGRQIVLSMADVNVHEVHRHVISRHMASEALACLRAATGEPYEEPLAEGHRAYDAEATGYPSTDTNSSTSGPRSRPS